MDYSNSSESLHFETSPEKSYASSGVVSFDGELVNHIESHSHSLSKEPTSIREQSRNENKRGRPKAAVISNLMIEGSNSVSDIKCKFCCRVFPREKSLQAHLRTHTGKHRSKYTLVNYMAKVKPII